MPPVSKKSKPQFVLFDFYPRNYIAILSSL